MSLTHRHPATLNPRAHYISTAFRPHEAALAQLEREAARLPCVPAPIEKPHSAVQRLARQRRRERAPPCKLLRSVCARFSLRHQCGEILLALWRAQGGLVSIADLGYPTKSISTAISQIRRALPPGATIHNEPCVGWSIPADQRGPLTAIIQELDR